MPSIYVPCGNERLHHLAQVCGDLRQCTIATAVRPVVGEGRPSDSWVWRQCQDIALRLRLAGIKHDAI